MDILLTIKAMNVETSPDKQKARNFRLWLILAIFWVIVLAKCILAQWAIIHYEIPINGWLFVWAPSCALGVFCTVIYCRYFGLCFRTR